MENGELVLEDRLYTKYDEWVKKIGENRYHIGITDYAQYMLKDIVQIELPKIGQELKQFQSFGRIDSQKATYDLHSPISGKVILVNQNSLGEIGYIDDNPLLTVIIYGGDLYNINKRPYEAWMIEVEADDKSQLEKLLKPDDYKKEIEKHKKSDKA